ncbi:MAG: OmpA/MotB family protein [Roseibacillus sp.]
MDQKNDWMGSVSDLMAGLMIVFLFIAIVYMMDAQEDKKRAEDLTEQLKAESTKIQEITATFEGLKQGLHEDLLSEFEKDLIAWDATLESDSTIRFNEPDILFATGSALLSPEFREILDDFFPRYIKILNSKNYGEEIEEIRVEGHTSSAWDGAESLSTRYLKNVSLSQMRSLEVLSYCFRIQALSAEQPWLLRHLRANGLSFAKPILTAEGNEDIERSRRVEFRVITKSEEKIVKILEIQESETP